MSGRSGVLPPGGDCDGPAPRTAGGLAQPGAGREFVLAREVRARGVVAGLTPAQIAAAIHDTCAPGSGTTWIRAHRLALGISLADVVAQVRAWYAREGRALPRFSETLLSAYESGQKRPGPEYLHYLCAVYRVDPPDLGYPDRCFCGRGHRQPATGPVPGMGRGGGAPGQVSPPGVPGIAATPSVPGGQPGAGLQPVPGAARTADGVPATVIVPGALAGAGAQPGGPPWASRGGPVPGTAGPGGAGERSASAAQAIGMVPDTAPAGGLPVTRGADAEDDDDILRRALLRLIGDEGVAVDGGFFGAVDRIRRRMDEALVSGTVSATMLDQWEETTAGYGRQYMSAPPLRLLCDVLLDFGDVRRVCEHRQPLDSAERLCRLAGQLAGLIGMIMINVGDQRLARSFFRTARTAADETGDRRLRAWVAVREAFVPFYYGDPVEACGLARTAAGLAGGSPGVAGMMARVMDARSLARAAGRGGPGGRRQARPQVTAMLGQAHEALARLPASARADTAFGYTERQLLFHEGDALVMVGRHAEADKAFHHALRMYAPGEVLDRSLVGFGLARCRLEAGEPEEALRLGLQTLLGVPRGHRSEILVASARVIGLSVARGQGEITALREYREALASC